MQRYVPADIPGLMVEFILPEVVNKSVKGLEAETFVDICQAYVDAWQQGALGSDTQRAIAMKCAMFLAACAKVGVIALIDEATGYQYERPVDALQFKLKLFLAEEMRKWEKTFPDELWEQFGRLTNWKGGVNSRPKYWGKLVMELIYEYLDPDVAQWLKDNAPRPVGTNSYHRWLTEQYGLKRLIEHIWKVIGVASTCETMEELRARMQELYGKRRGFQYDLKLTPAQESQP
ncbi:MAG: P63C domain-containing protein [Terriglobales bacterium]